MKNTKEDTEDSIGSTALLGHAEPPAGLYSVQSESVHCTVPVDTVICADNCEIMRQWHDGFVDMVVTSPPYDDLRTYGGHEWDFYGVAWNLVRLLKDGGVIVWVVGDQTKDGTETGTSMRQALHFQNLGLNIHDTMIYNKINYVPLTHNRCEQAWEYMFVLSKGKPKTWNPPMVKSGMVKGGSKFRESDGSQHHHKAPIAAKEEKIRSNVWEYSTGGQCQGHPAPFPPNLPSELIQAWSNPGDIILDPFAGSGTTLKAAKELNRKYLGIEVNPEYAEMCHNRTIQEVLDLFSA
jgi:site-specific DNA-methyltransferase (adenine-specific)